MPEDIILEDNISGSSSVQLTELCHENAFQLLILFYKKLTSKLKHLQRKSMGPISKRQYTFK